MTDGSPGSLRIPVAYAIGPLAGGLALAALGYLPTHSQGGPEAVRAMLLAQAMVVAVVYVTLLPAMWFMIKADAVGRLRVGLKAGAVRLVLTVVVAASLARSGWFAPRALLFWVALAYVALVLLEAYLLVCWGRRLERQACSQN